MNTRWDTIIEPKRSLLDLRLSDVWKYRDLLVLFVKRDISVIYKQTILGPLWFLLQPLLTTAVFVLVFGNIAKLPSDGLPPTLFYMAGIVLWNYFSDCFLLNSETFTLNAEVFGKVYFPRIIKPLSIIVSSALKFLIQLGLFTAILGYFAFSGTPIGLQMQLMLVPLLVILMAITGLGFGLITSALTTKYRDLKFLIQFGIQLAMYATPVIYPMSMLSEKMQRIVWFNPLAHIIEAFKYSIFGTGMWSPSGLLYSGVFAIGVLFIGLVVFNRTERQFMDVV